MENHTGPVMVVETAVVGFFSKLHSKGIYREQFQDELNCKLKTFFEDNKTDVMKRVNKIQPLRNWTGDSLPECQLVTVYPQWQERNRKYEAGQAVGISVPAMHRSIFRYLLQEVSGKESYDYVDHALQYDESTKEV